MGRDKRTYRFIKDTRHGRQVILETAQLEEMADRITAYVAHRLLERQRALESDADRQGSLPTEAPATDTAPRGKRFGWGALLAIFVLGLLAGAAALFAGALVAVSL